MKISEEGKQAKDDGMKKEKGWWEKNWEMGELPSRRVEITIAIKETSV